MIRTQIQLTEDQAKELRRRAAERDVSVASLIREAIDNALSGDTGESRWERTLEIIERSRFRSGLKDVAEKHDEYLAEDFVR